MEGSVPIGSLVVGKLYKIWSLTEPGEFGDDPFAPFTGKFVGMSGKRARIHDLTDKYGHDQGAMEFDDDYYSFFEIAGPMKDVSIDVKQSELPEHDPILYMPYTQGQRVIRIGKRNNWIYDRADIEQYWDKKGFKSNPLVGSQPIDENTIEYGTLNILPDGGRRRRRTKKSKRRARKTRRRV